MMRINLLTSKCTPQWEIREAAEKRDRILGIIAEIAGITFVATCLYGCLYVLVHFIVKYW